MYLFTEDGKPIYEGQTRSFRRDGRAHSFVQSREQRPIRVQHRPSGSHPADIDATGPRKAVSKLPDFAGLFDAAKSRVRAMEFRFVEIEDPPLRTIFEVYASLALGTHGDFNVFETH